MEQVHSGICELCQMYVVWPVGNLPDTQNCGLRMRRECRELFPRHRGLTIPVCTCGHARAVVLAGIADPRFTLKAVAGKTFPAFPAHAQPVVHAQHIYPRHCITFSSCYLFFSNELPLMTNHIFSSTCPKWSNHFKHNKHSNFLGDYHNNGRKYLPRCLLYFAFIICHHSCHNPPYHKFRHCRRYKSSFLIL